MIAKWRAVLFPGSTLMSNSSGGSTNSTTSLPGTCGMEGEEGGGMEGEEGGANAVQ